MSNESANVCRAEIWAPQGTLPHDHPYVFFHGTANIPLKPHLYLPEMSVLQIIANTTAMVAQD